ncbi:MAG TPA: type 4a pilus biogenesis protein PilO [Elusimicrobiota bacterium]|nr:type 4a pilus biogenesis protein PilO [Elusimicrobiota bacterium]HVC09719.1 type 4a pilus biogenesis protein PilO [Elusimicrobiota bacterium]
MNFKLKFKKISLDKKARQALAAAGGGAFAILSLYVWLLWLPLSGQIAAARKNLSDVNSKIAQATQEAQKKHRLDLELAQLNQTAAEASQRLPQSKDIPAVLVAVSDLAAQYNVQLQSFVSNKEISRGFFNELDFSVAVLGTYNDIGRFLAALSLQERIFNAADAVYGNPNTAGQIPAHFTLIAYQYKG